MDPFTNQITSSICFQPCLKGSNPFITSNTRSSMKAFYSSCDFLLDVVLPKIVELELGVTTFQTLEFCFLEGFVLVKC